MRLLFAIRETANQVTVVVAALLLAALAVTAILQVTFRYVLLEPLIWSEEAARYLLIWLTFLVGGIALRDNLHPRLVIFVSVLPKGVQRQLRYAIFTCVAAFLVAFVWVSADVAWRYLPFASLATGISQAVPRLALPVGGVLMLINLAALLDDTLPGEAGDDT